MILQLREAVNEDSPVAAVVGSTIIMMMKTVGSCFPIRIARDRVVKCKSQLKKMYDKQGFSLEKHNICFLLFDTEMIDLCHPPKFSRNV